MAEKLELVRDATPELLAAMVASPLDVLNSGPVRVRARPAWHFAIAGAAAALGLGGYVGGVVGSVLAGVTIGGVAGIAVVGLLWLDRAGAVLTRSGLIFVRGGRRLSVPWEAIDVEGAVGYDLSARAGAVPLRPGAIDLIEFSVNGRLRGRGRGAFAPVIWRLGVVRLTGRTDLVVRTVLTAAFVMKMARGFATHAAPPRAPLAKHEALAAIPTGDIADSTQADDVLPVLSYRNPDSGLAIEFDDRGRLIAQPTRLKLPPVCACCLAPATDAMVLPVRGLSFHIVRPLVPSIPVCRRHCRRVGRRPNQVAAIMWIAVLTMLFANASYHLVLPAILLGFALRVAVIQLLLPARLKAMPGNRIRFDFRNPAFRRAVLVCNGLPVAEDTAERSLR